MTQSFFRKCYRQNKQSIHVCLFIKKPKFEFEFQTCLINKPSQAPKEKKKIYIYRYIYMNIRAQYKISWAQAHLWLSNMFDIIKLKFELDIELDFGLKNDLT